MKNGEKRRRHNVLLTTEERLLSQEVASAENLHWSEYVRGLISADYDRKLKPATKRRVKLAIKKAAHP